MNGHQMRSLSSPNDLERARTKGLNPILSTALMIRPLQDFMLCYFFDTQKAHTFQKLICLNHCFSNLNMSSMQRDAIFVILDFIFGGA